MSSYTVISVHRVYSVSDNIPQWICKAFYSIDMVSIRALQMLLCGECYGNVYT
jgi:hypothetical protein